YPWTPSAAATSPIIAQLRAAPSAIDRVSLSIALSHVSTLRKRGCRPYRLSGSSRYARVEPLATVLPPEWPEEADWVHSDAPCAGREWASMELVQARRLAGFFVCWMWKMAIASASLSSAGL